MERSTIGPKPLIPLFLLLLAAGCATTPAPVEDSWELYRAQSVTADTFAGQTVAILPAVKIEFDPSQETYREALGGLMYAAFSRYKNSPRLIPMEVTQSLVNRAEIWSDVQTMYKDYEAIAVLRKDKLAKLGKALGARFVLLPKVLRFQQEVFDRVNIIGISFLKTRQATVNIHVQIWDTETGEVIWHGVGEGAEAAEVIKGRPLSFMTVVPLACASLATRLPWVTRPQPEPRLKQQSFDATNQ